MIMKNLRDKPISYKYKCIIKALYHKITLSLEEVYNHGNLCYKHSGLQNTSC